MCGLGGYIGIPRRSRLPFTAVMGYGIDYRGGHASGYTVVTDSRVNVGKKLGEWSEASFKFLKSASAGHAAMHHARFATCGKRSVVEAHPFAVKRDGKTKLWGMHNGVLSGTYASAWRHKRDHSVDSLELFELLADGLHEEIAKEISGYGTLAWIESDQRDRIKLVRMTDSADLAVAKIEQGGIVYGSTSHIVEAACEGAKLTIKGWFDRHLKPGHVCYITAEGFYSTDERVRLADRVESYYSRPSDTKKASGLYASLSDFQDDWADEEATHYFSRRAGQGAGKSGVDAFEDDGGAPDPKASEGETQPNGLSPATRKALEDFLKAKPSPSRDASGGESEEIEVADGCADCGEDMGHKASCKHGGNSGLEVNGDSLDDEAIEDDDDEDLDVDNPLDALDDLEECDICTQVMSSTQWCHNPNDDDWHCSTCGIHFYDCCDIGCGASAGEDGENVKRKVG